MLRRFSTLLILGAMILSVSIIGCSGGNSPIIPSTTQGQIQQTGHPNHVLWGVYNITIDPVSLQAEVVPVRGPAFTANVTQFMQPPISTAHMISFAVDITSDPLNGYFVVYVTLKHPFPGVNYYNGFDVRGILISDASGTLDYDAAAAYPVSGETMLLNSDGYSRWWNWEEFSPYDTVFGATFGKLAPPYQPNGTLNGYKYFADELDAEDPLSALDPSKRGMFTSFGENTRRYDIQFKMDGGNIVFDFNYAVDASWVEPDEAYDPEYPSEAFAPSANSAEAYMISVVDTGSTAWYVDETNKGGSLSFDIEVYDWQAAYNPSGVPGELAGLWLDGEVVSTPMNLLPGAIVTDGGATSSVFQVEIAALSLDHSGPNEIWIIAENADPNTYEPNLDNFNSDPFTWADSPLAAYLRTWVDISDVQTGPDVIQIDPVEGNQFDVVNATVTGSNFDNGCQVELRESVGSMVIVAENELWVDETEVTCDIDLADANLGLYDVVVINPTLLEGSLDDGFEVLEPDIIYVDDSNTSGTEDGTMSYPFNTIQEGLAAATAGFEVWVDDSGNVYNGPVTLVSGVSLISENWDGTDGDNEATIYTSSSASCVVGADNAIIDGFEIDAAHCGIECNGTSPEILNCRVVDIDSNSGRAIWLRNNSYARLDGVEVYDVTNTNYFGYATFYGILIENCDAAGADNVVIENTTVHYVHTNGLLGGGYSNPHGILINNSDGVQLTNVIVYDITGGNNNNAFGIRVANSADVELTNNVIYDVEKTYYYGSAYGLYFSGCTNLDVRNTIINRIRRSGGFQTAFGVRGITSTYTFEYNDVYDCTSGLYAGVGPGIGCISANPQFVSPGTDFHLASGSPCIDTGDPDSAYDDPDSSRNDMGAYGGPEGDW